MDNNQHSVTTLDPATVTVERLDRINQSVFHEYVTEVVIPQVGSNTYQHWDYREIMDAEKLWGEYEADQHEQRTMYDRPEPVGARPVVVDGRIVVVRERDHLFVADEDGARLVFADGESADTVAALINEDLIRVASWRP